MFSPSSALLRFEQRCAASTTNRCSQSCPCWHFLAPHRFVACLNEAFELAAGLISLDAYPSDVEYTLVNTLGHTWDSHTPRDGTSLDELRRGEATVFLAARMLPEETRRIVKRFTDERISEACDKDTEEENRVGILPCGVPPGDDSVQHWRLVEMTTRESWEQLFHHNTDAYTPVCAGCVLVAETEIAFSEEYAAPVGAFPV